MKTQSTQLLMEIDQNHLDRLTQVVEETVATMGNQTKIFSTADLWNIQRMKRMRVQRRMIA